jgi:hypothetical protein
LPEDLVRETVRQLIGEFGVGVLQLKDKPRMESMAVAFAAGG